MSIQERMFENDTDPIQIKFTQVHLVIGLYKALLAAENGDNNECSYEEIFSRFQEAYDGLNDSDKQDFACWKADNGYE